MKVKPWVRDVRHDHVEVGVVPKFVLEPFLKGSVAFAVSLD